MDEKKNAIKQDEKKFDSTDVKKDALFAVNAADGGILEIKLGELAQTYGTTPAIKSLGKMLAKDHVQLNKELSLAAWKNNITIPAFLSGELKKKYTDLLKKEGAAFDEAYINMMVQLHQDDLQTFNDEAKNGKDSDIQVWAEKAIPVLQHHLDVSDSLFTEINKGNTKIDQSQKN